MVDINYQFVRFFALADSWSHNQALGRNEVWQLKVKFKAEVENNC